MLDLEKKCWLRLCRSKNIGNKKFAELLKTHGSALNIINAYEESSAEISLASLDKIDNEIEQTAKFGASFIFASDASYPKFLKQIDSAPQVLTYKGDINILKYKVAGIVGTRNPSANGIGFTQKICRELAAHNVAVCSGLAKGIDAAAHKSALDFATIAVIAGGINYVYPKENASLFTQIVESGLLISELPIGTAPLANHFPQRNRIIAGISEVLGVTEATNHSGSLITAAFAKRYGRQVFATPGHPNDQRYSGTNYLIKNGANLLESSADLLNTFKINLKNSSSVFSTDNIVISELKILLNSLSFTPTLVDDVIASSGLPIDKAQILLMELELEGKIERSFGNLISLLR